MLLKVVALFLVFMIVMASVQKLLRGGKELPGSRKRKALDRLRCPKCRRIQIAEKPGPCDRADCEYR
jgi:hypothetical protein